MDRRDFIETCSASVTCLSALSAWPALAANARPQNYARVLLVNELGDPLKAATLKPQTNYVFHYPFEATPVFLLLIAVEFAVGLARGRNTYRLNDTLASIGLGVMSQVTGVFGQLLRIGLYTLVFEHVAITRLPADAWLRGRSDPAPAPDGMHLQPTEEFAWPIGRRPLPAPPSWSPGAFQR